MHRQTKHSDFKAAAAFWSCIMIILMFPNWLANMFSSLKHVQIYGIWPYVHFNTNQKVTTLSKCLVPSACCLWTWTGRAKTQPISKSTWTAHIIMFNNAWKAACQQTVTLCFNTTAAVEATLLTLFVESGWIDYVKYLYLSSTGPRIQNVLYQCFCLFKN